MSKEKGKQLGAAALAKKLSRSAFFISATVFAMVTALLFLVILFVVLGIEKMDCDDDAERKAAFITTQLKTVEAVLENSPNPIIDGDALTIVERIVQHNISVCGSAVAMRTEVARQWTGNDFCMVYSWRKSGEAEIHFKHLGDSVNYDYTKMEWYSVPMQTGKGHWSEPYYDDGGGDVMMCTYSHPFCDAEGEIAGVMTIDISLSEGIRQLVDNINTLSPTNDHGRTYLMSGNNVLMAGDTTGIGKHDYIASSKLEGIDWTLYRTVPMDDFIEDVVVVLIFTMVFYIVAIIFVLISNTIILRRIAKPEVQNQMRLMTELDMAARIQQGMLPRNAKEANHVRATMTPAKEVGGDFYNYFQDDGRLYFVIADVSGKGMPAAIIMAIATELFLVTASGETDASNIVKKINHQLSRDNDASMFVTMIVGILDLEKGELQLCNAGHNPPYIIERQADAAAKATQLALHTNCPAALFDGFPYQADTIAFPQGSRLVLYTDGVTEAENGCQEQFGEHRLEQILTEYPSDICAAVENAVHAFANGAEQSDDITIMVIDN